MQLHEQVCVKIYYITCFWYAQKGLGGDGMRRHFKLSDFQIIEVKLKCVWKHLTFWTVLSHNSYCLACILQSCCCLFMGCCLQVNSIYLQIIQKILFIKINVCVYYYHHKYRLMNKKRVNWIQTSFHVLWDFPVSNIMS